MDGLPALSRSFFLSSNVIFFVLLNFRTKPPTPQALCTGGLDPRDLKTALFCISFLRKGEVLAYVRLPQNLKDPKDLKDQAP